MKKYCFLSIMLCIFSLSSCANPTVGETFVALDTAVSVIVSGENPADTKEAVTGLIKSESETLVLCYDLPADEVLPNVSDLVLKTEQLNNQYGYAVNIFCGELTELWGISTDNPRIPTDSEIEAVLEKIPTDKSGIIPGVTKIDPGAVAKGYVLDKAKTVLEASADSTEYAIISTQSSILLYGEKPGGEPFLTGIKNGIGGLAGYIKTDAAFISTTGGAERFVYLNTGHIPDEVFIHILDLSTGYPSRSDLVSVTVIIPADEENGGIKSDFLSTAMFLTGRENLESYGVTYVAIDNDGTVLTNTEVFPYE
jgi:thiamine biosynthesis lipoprotein